MRPVCSSKIRWVACFVCFLMTFPVTAFSYVLPASHVLNLMTRNIKEPRGLEIVQVRSMQSIDREDDVDQGFQTREEQVEEHLWFRFPGRFRSEILSENRSRILVVSGDESVLVEDGSRLSQLRSPAEHYMDILLFRDRQGLTRQLESQGVDVTQSSLQRLDNRICFVVGNVSDGETDARASSLWIDKETLFPARYILYKDGWEVDIYYRQWEKTSQTWCPKEISVFLDKSPLFLIHVDRIALKSDIPDSMFDVDMLTSLYPEKQEGRDLQTSEDVNDIQKSIDDFSKLYE